MHTNEKWALIFKMTHESFIRFKILNILANDYVYGVILTIFYTPISLQKYASAEQIGPFRQYCFACFGICPQKVASTLIQNKKWANQIKSKKYL